MGVISEFKTFVNRGNVVDMAVGVIIGGAFTSVVTSFTGNIVNPLINFVTGTTNGTPNLTVSVPNTTIVFDFGAFIGSVVNFLIVAITVFLLVKAFNKAQTIGEKSAKAIAKKTGIGPNGEALPETLPPACPFCLEEVKEGAVRCPHCAAELPEPAKPRSA